MENNNTMRFFGMVGMAMRAGRLIIGSDLICKAMAKGTVRLVVVSDEASDGTKKRLFTKSRFYNISAIEVQIDADRLGKLLGKTYAPVAFAVTDVGLANEIEKASVNMTKGSFR